MKWEDYALRLLEKAQVKDKDTEVGLIKQECKGETLAVKCQKLLNKWKESSIQPPQWEQVIEVLRIVGIHDVARELLQILRCSQQGENIVLLQLMAN